MGVKRQVWKCRIRVGILKVLSTYYLTAIDPGFYAYKLSNELEFTVPCSQLSRTVRMQAHGLNALDKRKTLFQ